jgi:hypothetical protein
MGVAPGFERSLIYGQNLNAASGKHIINLLLQERELIVDISCLRKPTWEYAGTLNRLIGHIEAPIVLETLPLGFDSQVIRFTPIKYPYFLAFVPAKWLSNYTLQFWRFKMPLYFDPSGGMSSGSATQALVPASNNPAVDLLAANPNRKGFSIFNNSPGVLYIGYGVAPTTTAFAAKINSQVYFEAPINFTGVVKGLWSNNNGNAQVTEFT